MNGTDTMNVTFSLNGETRCVRAAADSRLIDLLRDEFSLTSAKKACGIGRCGSCTVLLGGLPANACLLMLWQLDGRDIITPEGLDALPGAQTIRATLETENAFQCGYCAPGFSVALTALLRENPEAGEADIRAALDGNICRCTGYHSIIRGALAAAEALRNMRASTGVTP